MALPEINDGLNRRCGRNGRGGLATQPEVITEVLGIVQARHIHLVATDVGEKGDPVAVRGDLEGIDPGPLCGALRTQASAPAAVVLDGVESR